MTVAQDTMPRPAIPDHIEKTSAPNPDWSEVKKTIRNSCLETYEQKVSAWVAKAGEKSKYQDRVADSDMTPEEWETLYKGKSWLDVYDTYVKPERPATKEQSRRLSGVNSEIRCKEAELNSPEEELELADMVRVFRIMNGFDNIKKEDYWLMAEDGPGLARRYEREETSFAARTAAPWKALPEDVRLETTPRKFRESLKKHWNLL